MNAKNQHPNLYEILGCSQSSTTEQIQAEYRSRVLVAHPDKRQDKDNDEFQLLQQAKEILTDPAKRKHYDTFLSIGSEMMDFNEWMKQRERLQQTFHWAAPTLPTPAISSNEAKIEKPQNQLWTERHTSANINAFRNYEI